MRNLLLPVLVACLVLSPRPGFPDAGEEKTAKTEDTPVFGEIEFAERLQNPDERQKVEGKVIEIVGELTTLSKPTEAKPNVEMVGFGKTYQTTLYRVRCQLAKPLKKEEFERISRSGFVVLRGRCSITTKIKEVGTDVWYDFDITLQDGRIRYWEPPAVGEPEKP